MISSATVQDSISSVNSINGMYFKSHNNKIDSYTAFQSKVTQLRKFYVREKGKPRVEVWKSMAE